MVENLIIASPRRKFQPDMLSETTSMPSYRHSTAYLDVLRLQDYSHFGNMVHRLTGDI